MRSMSARFDKLLEIRKEKGVGSINPGLVSCLNAYSRVESLRCQVRFAEAELEHAIRGLDHPDYDSQFEGWERTK